MITPQKQETGFGSQEKREIHLDVGLERFGLNSSFPQRKSKKLQLLKERISTDVVLSDVNSALFFSQWHYAAVKIIVALPCFTNPETIAETLGLPLALVIEPLEFLIHLSSNSPFVSRHHANWRIKAIGQLDLKKEENLFYTKPANLSHQDAQKIRNLLMETLQKSTEIMDSSQAETMYCLNLD